MDGWFGTLGLMLIAMGLGAAVRALVAHPEMSIIRAYRDDPWPSGVQEDDDFHYNWRRPPGNKPADDSGDVIDLEGPADVAVGRVVPSDPLRTRSR